MAIIIIVRKVVIITIVIGALGTLSRNYERCLDGLEVRQLISLLQKTWILGTAKVIISRTLDT